MADKWSLFKQFWKTDDEDAVITDASSANDYLVEDAIGRFQEISKEITDITVTLSAARAEVDDLFIKLREAVTLAYNAVLQNDVSGAKKHLEKVVGL